MRADIAYWLAFARFDRFGAVSIGKIADTYADMKEAWGASVFDLVAAGLPQGKAQEFDGMRHSIDPERELRLLQQHGLTAITPKDKEYPEPLRHIFAPPAVLLLRGTLPDPRRLHVAVVGSRHPTAYGKQCAREIVAPMARAGVVVVSGLAYGIDACAHEAVLEQGGCTVAVLGGGLDDANVYPSQHRHLLRRIVEGGGAILTEHPIGTASIPSHFPYRNRIIAGMCQATLVVEAELKSGSLSTADHAKNQNRDVFAVPGSIHSPLSAGPLSLIRQGAKPVTCADDLLGEYHLKTPKDVRPPYVPESRSEEAVYSTLGREPIHLDAIVERTRLPAHDVSATLTLMELRSGARHMGGHYYARG